MKIFHSPSPPPTPGKICAICELGNFAIVCSGKMEEIGVDKVYSTYQLHTYRIVNTVASKS